MADPAFSFAGIYNTANWPVRVIYESLQRCQNGVATCDAEITRICQTLGGSEEYISKSPVTKFAKAVALVRSGIINSKQIARLAGCSVQWARTAKRK